jgi:parallel beta-helix repeat protein
LCEVHHNDRDTSFIGGALRGVGPIRHVVFEDCLSHHNSVGIELRESPTQINSSAHVPPTAGNTGFANDLPEDQWDAWEGWTAYAARYCAIRRCVVYDNRTLDEHSDGIMTRYTIETTVQENISFRNADDNYDGLGATRGVFVGNIAFQANPENTIDGDGNGMKVGVRGGLDNLVARNIAFDNPRGGIDMADTERAKVYNNTVFHNGEWFGIWFEATRAQAGGMRVLNNICRHNGTLGGRSDIGRLTGVRLLAYDHNCVSDDASGSFAPPAGPNGFVSTDPLFTNESLVVDTVFPAGLTIPERLAFIRAQVYEKLSLTVGSPVIDRGAAIPGVTDAFAGGAPDLGAIEAP